MLSHYHGPVGHSRSSVFYIYFWCSLAKKYLHGIEDFLRRAAVEGFRQQTSARRRSNRPARQAWSLSSAVRH